MITAALASNFGLPQLRFYPRPGQWLCPWGHVSAYLCAADFSNSSSQYIFSIASEEGLTAALASLCKRNIMSFSSSVRAIATMIWWLIILDMPSSEDELCCFGDNHKTTSWQSRSDAAVKTCKPMIDAALFASFFARIREYYSGKAVGNIIIAGVTRLSKWEDSHECRQLNESWPNIAYWGTGELALRSQQYHTT